MLNESVVTFIGRSNIRIRGEKRNLIFSIPVHHLILSKRKMGLDFVLPKTHHYTLPGMDINFILVRFHLILNQVSVGDFPSSKYGLLLAIKGASTANSANFQQFEDNGTRDPLWRI